MAYFRSERGIGRGEPAESTLEFPFFILFMAICAIALLLVHTYGANTNVTIALAISMVVFGLTVLRVDLGVYCIAVAMLLSPEIDAGGVGQGERRLTLRYDDVLIIVIFVGVMVKQAFRGGKSLWLPSPINIAIAIYYSICLISTFRAFRLGLTAYDQEAAFFIMLKMAQYYMIFLLVGTAINSPKQVRSQLALFFFVAFFVNLYSLYSRQAYGRVSAPFETGGTEPNTVGGYLVLVMCMATGLLLKSPSKKTRFALLLVIVVSFVPFLLALSRASYIAFVVSGLTMGIITKRYSIAGLIVAGLILSPYLMPQEVIDRVNYTFQQGTGEDVAIAGVETGLQVDKSTYERIYVWEKVKYNMLVWPILGGGVGWGLVLDSQYARVMIETGIVGMIAFIFLQTRILRTAWETHRWSTDWVGRGLAIGMTAATIGLVTHSLGTITFLIVRIMSPFWFLLALTVVCRNQAILDHWRRKQLQTAKKNASAEAVIAEPSQGLPSPQPAHLQGQPRST